MTALTCDTEADVIAALGTDRIAATKPRRKHAKLVTETGREIVDVLCLDRKAGSVLAIVDMWEGDLMADALNLNGVRCLNANDEYIDALPVVERRALKTISDAGRMED